MRLDADGSPVEDLPFLVTQAPAAQTNPQVSWNGENWLVVWHVVDKHLPALVEYREFDGGDDVLKQLIVLID